MSTSFTVQSPLWLKAVIWVGTIGFGALSAGMAWMATNSLDPAGLITAIAVAAASLWLAVVGLRLTTFFGSSVCVNEARITVFSHGAENTYALEELRLRTRPIAHAIELRHPKTGLLYAADTYATNALALIQLFERHFAMSDRADR